MLERVNKYNSAGPAAADGALCITSRDLVHHTTEARDRKLLIKIIKFSYLDIFKLEKKNENEECKDASQ